jgi:hypothetical protein
MKRLEHVGVIAFEKGRPRRFQVDVWKWRDPEKPRDPTNVEAELARIFGPKGTTQ